jgi:hypothetical protein
MTAQQCIKLGVLGILLLTVFGSATLVLKVMTSQSNIKAGIATFRVSSPFGLSNI